VGLLSAIVGYRTGVKKGRRSATVDAGGVRLPAEFLEVCSRCGHFRMRHDDDGRCPSYE